MDKAPTRQDLLSSGSCRRQPAAFAAGADQQKGLQRHEILKVRLSPCPNCFPPSCGGVLAGLACSQGVSWADLLLPLRDAELGLRWGKAFAFFTPFRDILRHV